MEKVRNSASLAIINPDCLAELILYLNGDDFVSLMSTGDHLLRQKLAHNCQILNFVSLTNTKFPFAALKLPKLRSLSMCGIKGVYSFMDFRNGGELALAQGSKTIEKIKLCFQNSLALFMSPGNVSPSLSVRDRFPSLTTLVLRDIVFEESSESP